MKRTLFLLLLLSASLLHAGWLKEGRKKTFTSFDPEKNKKAEDNQQDRRGKVVIRRLKPQCKSDWNVDPTALPMYFHQLRIRTQGKFPCYIDNEGLEISSKEIFEYPIIYFTSHYKFEFSNEEVENLKKYLARGGTLWLDDCAGSSVYTDCCPPNIQRIIPGAEFKIWLPAKKEFKDFFDIIYKITDYPALASQSRQPFQSVELNGRKVIMLCPNDYGCYWEVSSPPTALNPLGNQAHGDTSPRGQALREETYQLSINWLFYTLTH